MFHRRALIASLASIALFVTSPAFGQQAVTENLEISGGFARATPPMARVGIAYLTITSLGEADRLVGYSTPACNRPELHTHIENDGVMQMRQVEAIEVPAGGVAALKPGGFHMMMIDLTEQLVEGGTVALTLVFEEAGEVGLEVPILAMGAMGAMGDMAH
ncbi:MAG TPA: hypothetical protein DIU07_19720 [Rhodobacteraceae bacterium]|nr:hypothetical protein [Paracoccaceae bacterium]